MSGKRSHQRWLAAPGAGYDRNVVPETKTSLGELHYRVLLGNSTAAAAAAREEARIHENMRRLAEPTRPEADGPAAGRLRFLSSPRRGNRPVGTARPPGG